MMRVTLARRAFVTALCATVLASCQQDVAPPETSALVTQANSAGTDWQFWQYTAGFYAFNPSGACTVSGCANSGCPCNCDWCDCYGVHDLDWSGGYYNRGGVLRLPCDAMMDPDVWVQHQGGSTAAMWQVHFHCVNRPDSGFHFQLNHLQHPPNQSNGWLTNGQTYNAGTAIGLIGGTLADEGAPDLSTGDHACMETPQSGPPGCQAFPTSWDPTAGWNNCGYSTGASGLANPLCPASAVDAGSAQDAGGKTDGGAHDGGGAADASSHADASTAGDATAPPLPGDDAGGANDAASGDSGGCVLSGSTPASCGGALVLTALVAVTRRRRSTPARPSAS
jgi:hypothetical protein